MPGPPPNPNARRRNARPDWRNLPASGRTEPAPEWPLPTWPSDESIRLSLEELWASLWATPQATVWAELGWTRVVARYAFLVNASEMFEGGTSGTAAIMAEIRQLEDRLGLTPMAMKRLQWEIEPAPVVAAVSEVANLDSRRRRRT